MSEAPVTSQASEVGQEAWDTWRAFVLMRRQLDGALEKRLQRDGISAADYSILITVYEAPDKRRRSRDLAHILAWEKSRVSHQVSRMESRGLVAKVACDDDARGSWISLTPDGKRAALRASRDHSRAIHEYFFDVLSEEELFALKVMSTRVLNALDPEACDILRPENDEVA